MAFSLATLTRVLVATAALVGGPGAHALEKGADAPSPWGADYAPDVVEPGAVEGTPKPMRIFGAPTLSDEARLAADFFIRAMPLGASITQGVASTDGNGYRKYFRDQLRFNGWKVNMVGSKQDGTMNDRDNEGHPGWIIDEVYDAARRSIGLHPNLVMINVGTNDCIRNLDTGNAGARMRRLVDYLFAEIPGTTVLLSTLVPSLNDNNERCAQSVNAQYRSLVSSYGGNQRIFLADMHAFLTRSDIDPDGIHPNNGGYKKMASVWWDAFRRAERTLQAPDNSVDDAREVNGEPSTCPKRPEQGRGPIHTQRETGYDNGGYEHKSTPRGIMATVPNLQSNTYIIAQLVNAGGAPRGGEVDELIRIERQGDGSHRYSYLLNLGGRFSNAWTGFSVPACSGNVQHIFADLNNDGLDDFWCIGDRGQASVAINRGGQPPRFESIGEVFGGPGGRGPGDVLVADVDGDGRADYCVRENNGDIRCWRNGGMGDTVAYWQGFMSENTGGDVVFSRGIPNKYMVRLADINGDSRADWMYIGDQGEVDTVINQRGWGLGIKPHWRDSGRSHGGMRTPGAGAQIRFGRVFGSGRLDYIWLKPAGNNIEVEVYENIGDGGQRMKGDGTFYCDMTGSGSDDYIWVWSGGDKAELRINTHNWPNWQEGLPNLFNIQRDRRSIHLADWDGDGKCDILSQNKATGDLEMWRNEYNPQTGRFSFPYVGRVNGPARCTEGWGVNIFDRGLRLADIDGDGRADYLCLEKDGRVTGALNKAGGMQNVGQIKFAEGWDRANIRFADVENGGKADMIWLNKYNGAATVLKNKGPIPAGGSAFTWEKRGVLYNSVGERGLNMNFANLGGLGRADFVKVLPRSNNADTWFNECPGGNGGGDDGAIGDPQLPPYSSNRQKASRFRRW